MFPYAQSLLEWSLEVMVSQGAGAPLTATEPFFSDEIDNIIIFSRYYFYQNIFSVMLRQQI